MSRGIYLLKSLCTHKEALKQLFRTPVSHAIDITPDWLQTHGIKALVLDFDGVLASLGQKTLHPDVIPWLQALSQQKDLSLWILSNNPSSARQQFFATHFPSVQMIMGARKKPYPDGLLTIIQEHHYLPTEILMVDDRLLTGCLAALNAGTQAVWISKPYRRVFSRKMFFELYFSMLRTLDKLTLL